MTLDDLMVQSRGLGDSSQARAQKIRFLLARRGRALSADLQAELLGRSNRGNEQDVEGLTSHIRMVADDIQMAARAIEQGVEPEHALELLDHIFWWVAAAEVALALKLGPWSALDAMSEASCTSGVSWNQGSPTGLSSEMGSDLAADRDVQRELLAMAAKHQPFTPVADGVQWMADALGGGELVFGQALMWVIISMMPKTHDWGWDLGYMPCLSADLFPERLASVFRHLQAQGDQGRVGISMNTLYYSGRAESVLAGDDPAKADRSQEDDEIVWVALEVLISEAERASLEGNASFHERWRTGAIEAARDLAREVADPRC